MNSEVWQNTRTRMANRRLADLLLFAVTAVEFVLLFLLTPTFGIADWIYLLQHLMVFVIALTRAAARAHDYSISSTIAVAVAYLYPYAQVICLRWKPGEVASPDVGLVLVVFAAALSFISLAVLGNRFGVRPAWRDLVTSGPYRLVRHPMYLSYFIADLGYNLLEWNYVTVVLVLAGWGSLIYRIRAEERVLAQDGRWSSYAKVVRYRLIPGLW